MSDRCRSCGAQIFWAVTANGKRMPLDAQPHPEGNLVLRTQAGPDGQEALDDPLLCLSVAAVAKLEEHGIPARLGEPRYLSHFATCPQAGQHRRKGSK